MELAIAMFIGVTLLTLVMVSLTTTVQTGLNAVASGHANDENNLALNEIQRQVVSADVIYDPTVDTPTSVTPTPTHPTTLVTIKNHTTTGGYLLRLLTNYKGSTTCVQWRLTNTGELQFRSWAMNHPTTLAGWNAGWQTVVTGLLTTTPPFSTASSTPAYGNRILTVTLVAKSGAASTRLNPTAEVSASFPSLDAQFYPITAPNFCTAPPNPSSSG